MFHDVNHLIDEGRTAVERGDREDAIIWFERAIEIDGENVEAMLWLAGLSDDPADGLRYVNMALELEPDNPNAHEALAWARRRMTAETPAAPYPSMDPEPPDLADRIEPEEMPAGVAQPAYVPVTEPSAAEVNVFDLREVAVPRDDMEPRVQPATRKPISVVALIIAFMIVLLLIGVAGIVYTIVR